MRDPKQDIIRPIVLEGSTVRLEPLLMAHLDGLCAIGLDGELWRWSPFPVRTREEMRTYIEQAVELQARGEALPFAVIERATARAIGSTRYGNIDLFDRRLEIGWTWIGRSWQRTVVNTECKYLLLRHAFEALGCRRVEFKTDALNERSRSAISRIGAIEEGTLRRHMTTASGRVRDSVYYSIIDREWPEVKTTLTAMLTSAGGTHSPG